MSFWGRYAGFVFGVALVGLVAGVGCSKESSKPSNEPENSVKVQKVVDSPRKEMNESGMIKPYVRSKAVDAKYGHVAPPEKDDSICRRVGFSGGKYDGLKLQMEAEGDAFRFFRAEIPLNILEMEDKRGKVSSYAFLREPDGNFDLLDLGTRDIYVVMDCKVPVLCVDIGGKERRLNGFGWDNDIFRTVDGKDIPELLDRGVVNKVYDEKLGVTEYKLNKDIFKN